MITTLVACLTALVATWTFNHWPEIKNTIAGIFR